MSIKCSRCNKAKPNMERAIDGQHHCYTCREALAELKRPIVVAHKSESIMIGDTLFVDGSPHHVCGHCGDILGSADYERKIVSSGATKSKGKIVKDGKVAFESKPYKITILNYWIEGEDKHYMKDGYPTVEHTWIPNLTVTTGCLKCWNEQVKRKLAFPNGKLKDWVYNKADCHPAPVKVSKPAPKLNWKPVRTEED